MLQADLINKLDIIAFEGWEYHKLPLENLEELANSPISDSPAELPVATFLGKSKQPELIPIGLPQSPIKPSQKLTLSLES